MKKTIKAYIKLTFFAILFAFLIWGLIQIVSVFSVQVDGWFSFLSVITPNIIALGYIGFNVAVSILGVKQVRKPAETEINLPSNNP